VECIVNAAKLPSAASCLKVTHVMSCNCSKYLPTCIDLVWLGAVTIPNTDGTTQFLRFSEAGKYDFEGEHPLR
jgi:hypothetical protein